MVNQFGIAASGSGSGNGVVQIMVQLNGIAWTTLDTLTRGSYRIQVVGQMAGGPVLNFEYARSVANAVADMGPVTSSPGLNGTVLGVDWPAAGKIRLAKSTVSYNGSYLVTIVG